MVPAFLGEEGTPPIDQFPASIERKVGATIELLQMGIALVMEGAWLGYFPEISVRALLRRGDLRSLPIETSSSFALRATFRPTDQHRALIAVTLDALRSALKAPT